MQFGYKSTLALMAILKLAAAGAPMNVLYKRNVVVVTQEVLEIVGYTSTVWVQPPPPSTTAKIETPSPTTTEAPAPIVVEVPETSSSPSPTPSPTPEPQPSPQPVKDSSSGGSLSGKATFYAAGLGSCGQTHSDSDMICALSKITMSLTAGANPNLNPKCGQKIRIKSNSNSEGVVATIVDTCPGCSGPNDLDLSPALFDQLGNQLEGVIDITWEYV